LLRNFKSVVVIGGTGTGKTFFIENYLKEIIADVNDLSQLVIVNPSRLFLHKFKNSPKTILYLKENLNSKLDEELIPLIEQRKANLDNKKDNSDRPTLYFFIDEYALAFENKQKKADKFFTDLVYNRKELNVVVVLSTQMKQSIPLVIRKTVDTYIVLQ